ncbi:hypothetical protein C475_04406 [Halosimplex carlsbadense 2-9-1]|uniref:Uncharacterized protein n=1 Tax=Halosimplex carlsbadense 2-9-1 TaxID=797114 RepID=M0D3W1_9EURY|nr:hypothetical protein C475_04406 [Halosimplex carlsbadense 2-9-1]
MNDISTMSFFAVTPLEDRSMCRLGTCLLKIAAYTLELTVFVYKFLTSLEMSGASDGKIFDTEVNPENYPVLSGRPLGIGLRFSESEVEKIVVVTCSECRFGQFPFIAFEILVLVSFFVIG